MGLLVESFDVSGTPGRLLFLVNPDDLEELKAVTDASLHHDFVGYITTAGVTWPEKINVGFRYARTIAEWALFCADDVTFHEGWWDQTAALRAQPEINVIGTNDLGNAAVMAGDHATHPLVRCSYLGTVDDPDSIVCPLYSHWYVDNEFVVTAKIRGCWAPCLSAVVEHNHPYWHKGEWDDTYTRGEANSIKDGILWESRIPLLQKLDRELNA